MRRRGRPREAGTALIIALLFTIVLFATTGALFFVSQSSARAVGDEIDRHVAFYLAEGGLEAAMRELAFGEDVDGGGTGAISQMTSLGRCDVFPVEVEPDIWRLSSVGTANGSSVTLQEVVERVQDVVIPPAAVSFIGSPNKDRVRFRKHVGLIIDGGDTPALRFSTDEEFYDDFLEDVDDAIEHGEIERENITGKGRGKSEEDPPAEGSVEEAFEWGGQEPEVIGALAVMYGDMRDRLTGFLPQAQIIPGLPDGGDDDVYAFGSAEAPAVVRFADGTKLEDRDRIVGHGTLIISDKMEIKEDAMLDWTGDVIVFADQSKKGKLVIDGRFRVNGNVIVLGEGSQDVEFKVGDDASAQIDGCVLIGTDFAGNRGKKAKIEVDGPLTVNGILCAIGSKLYLKAKNDSDLEVNGLMMFGVREAAGTEVKLEFDGDVEIRHDADKVRRAAGSLKSLADRLQMSTIGAMIAPGIVRRGWLQVGSYAQ